MKKREWICKRCNPNYPCRKSFTGYDGVWADVSPSELKRGISPFHKEGDEHRAEWVEVTK